MNFLVEHVTIGIVQVILDHVGILVLSVVSGIGRDGMVIEETLVGETWNEWHPIVREIVLLRRQLVSFYLANTAFFFVELH